jgi:hypothetical protein
MTSTNWKAIAELIGIFAIVASLIFVGLQIQQDRRVASGQVNMATLETIVAIDTVMTEHAHVWVKARDLKDLSEAEIQIVERLVHMAKNKAFFEALASLKISSGGGPIDFRKARGPILAFAVLLHENPGARRVWAASVERDEKYFEKTGGNSGQDRFNNVVREFLLQLQN